MESLKGHLLMAAPDLSDPNFVRTVVLMIEHDEQGAFGVVLNHPSGRTVEDVWDELSEDPCACQQAINVGGPVVGPLLAVHTDEDLAEAKILPGVFLAAQRDHLDELVRRDKAKFRLFSGYSGWGQGQLENEMKQGGWITAKATKKHIFAPAEELWSLIGRQITESVYGSALDPGKFPADPSNN